MPIQSKEQHGLQKGKCRQRGGTDSRLKVETNPTAKQQGGALPVAAFMETVQCNLSPAKYMYVYTLAKMQEGCYLLGGAGDGRRQGGGLTQRSGEDK